MKIKRLMPLLVVFLVACGSGTSVSPSATPGSSSVSHSSSSSEPLPAVPVTSVALSASTSELRVGQSTSITAEVLPANATNKSLTYSSSNDGFATVSAAGVVTAIAEGEVTITATANNAITGTIAFTIIEAGEVELNAIFTVVHAETADTIADLSGIENGNLFSLVSINDNRLSEHFASITAKSKIYKGTNSSLKLGTSSLNGLFEIQMASGYIAKKVTLNANSWKNSSGAYDEAAVKITGETAQPTTAEAVDYVFEISTQKISIESVKRVYIYSITVEYEIFTAIPVSSVDISSSVNELEVSKTTTLISEVLPADATNKTLSFSSSDDAIATVSSSGVVTGVSKGEVTITATAHNGITDSVIIEIIDEVILVPVTSVVIASTVTSLEIGDSVTLDSEVLPVDATNKTLTFTSANNAVATVDASGKVTAVGVGEVVITATSINAISGTITITVNEQDEDVLKAKFTVTHDYTGTADSGTDLALTPANADLFSVMTLDKSALSTHFTSLTAKTKIYKGLNSTLKFGTSSIAGAMEVQLADGYIAKKVTLNAISWTTATGPEAGAGVKITGETVQSTSGVRTDYVFNISAQKFTIESVKRIYLYEITVEYEVFEPVAVASVSLSSAVASLEVGETTTLTSEVLPADATDKALTYSSSNTSFATVSAAGVVTAVSAGEVTITATTSNGKSDSVVIEIVAKPVIAVESVSLSSAVASLEVGETTTLTSEVLPADATDKSLTYSSNNEALATVSTSGVVTGVGAGEVTITATSNNDITDSVVINIIEKVITTEVESVAISAAISEIEIGKTTTLVAEVLPVDASDKSLTYSSSDDAIATVSTAGVVTGVSTGEVTITATSHNGKTGTKVFNIVAAAETLTAKFTISHTYASTTNAPDSTTALAANFNLATNVFQIDNASLKSHIKSMTAISQIFYGRESSLKFGNSSNGGEIDIELVAGYTIKKITLNAVDYFSPPPNVAPDNAAIMVTGCAAQALAATAADYVFDVSASSLSKFKISSVVGSGTKKRLNLFSVTIEYAPA